MQGANTRGAGTRDKTASGYDPRGAILCPDPPHSGARETGSNWICPWSSPCAGPPKGQRPQGKRR